MIGGDAANTRVRMVNNDLTVWRQSMALPYASGTVYHPTTFIKDNKVC